MVIGLFHPVVGGAEKACQTLSKRLMGKGISVTILTQYRDGLPEQEIIDGIPVYRKMKGWHPFGLTYMFSVLSFLIKNRECYFKKLFENKNRPYFAIFSDVETYY